MRLASFDIFDTALIRKCGSPEAIFALLAQKLFPDSGDAQNTFLDWRRSVKTSTATLHDIYAFRQEAFCNCTVEQLIDAELSVESENLTANSAIRDLIAQKRAEGYTIKFISDMYLPSQFLADVLRREGCLLGDEEVVVSCEHNARKDTGAMYDLIRKKYSPIEWLHWGDNIKSDVKMAKRHGVKSTHVDASFSSFEKDIIAARVGQPIQHQRLAAASRAARTHLFNSAEAILAADYIVPAYLPYVLFVLKEARKQGLKRLYFLSRDGYILYRIAQFLVPDDIELRYFFVSRKSLKKDRALIKQYFHQEQLDAGDNGIVDIGWYGSTRKMINELLDEMAAPRVSTFYFAVRADVLPSSFGDYSFYQSFEGCRLQITPLLESYFSASPYASTIDYTIESDKVVPVFDEIHQPFVDGVVRINIEIAKQILSILSDIESFDAELLRFWSREAVLSLASMRHYVDVAPMTNFKSIDEKPLVKHLSARDFFYLTLGNHITGFDCGSIYLNYGKFWGCAIWHQHKLACGTKEWLYSKIKKNS